MNIKELYIISSILEQTLVKYELEGLKERLSTSDNYNKFLEKLLVVIIGKDKSIALLDFLTLNALGEKFIAIQNKKSDVIEELAELHFKSFSSDNTLFLIESNNEIFLNHLNFLKDTQNAFVVKERIDLKKKLQKLDELSTVDLSDDDIKTAFNVYERQKLKEHLLELKPKERDDTKIISFNFKTILKYAAILVLVIGPAIFIINRLNNSNKQELAERGEIKSIDTLKIEKAPYKFQLPEAEKYIGESNLLEEQKFGFSSSDLKKVKIVIYNLNGQLKVLANELDGNKADSSITNYLNHKIDSINTIKETYTYDNEGELKIYSVRLKSDKKTLNDLKLLSIDRNDKKNIYLKIGNSFFPIKQGGNNHLLKEEKNESFIDQLKLIENQ